MTLLSRVACALWMPALLVACGPAAAPPPAAASLRPADADLAALYEQSCKACHAQPASGAPSAGDRAAWAPRLEQGMATLMEHTVNGYRGMPPLGSCADCGEDELAALIRFMAGEPGV